MSDYQSSLPVRSEADADERLQSKIVDFTTPSQGMEVDTDKNAHVEIHGNDPAGVDRVVRTSELGALTPDGLYDVSNNTKPGTVGLVASARAASPGDSDLTKKPTVVSNSTVHAIDISLHDEDGAAYSETNPLPVVMAETEGTPINDYKVATVAGGGTDNHDYTVTALKTLYLTKVTSTGSGKAKMEVQIETAVGSGTFNSKFVQFNSTATPNMAELLREPIAVAAGVRVRVIMSNRDNQSQDMYSTISGHEV